MKIGKLSEMVFKRSILKQIRNNRRSEIILKPSVGENNLILGVESNEGVVLSENLIMGDLNHIGELVVHKAANEILCKGAEFIGVMLTILLPDGARESDLRKMIQMTEAACLKLNAEVLKVYTELMNSVNQPIITITGVGKVNRSRIITSKGAKDGDDIVMTKWAGLEGTFRIAKEKESELTAKYTKSFIGYGMELERYISVAKEVAIGKELEVSSMYNASNGGVFGALWELGAASNIGFEVDLKSISLRQETVEICEFYDLNPYMLMSGGVLLMTTKDSKDLVNELKRNDISAAIIGNVNNRNQRIVFNEDEKRFLEPPKYDELHNIV